MKRKSFKFFKVSVCWLLGIMLLVSCAGCFFGKKTEPEYEERESGDFIVWFYDDYCEIYGTTEQGNNKRFLVIPEFIEGVRVDALGYRSILGALNHLTYDDLTFPKIESSVLEKIYFEKPIHFYPWLGNEYLGVNFKKMISLGREPRPDKTRGLEMYYPRSVYEEDTGISFHTRKHPANVSFYYNYDNGEASDYYWIDDCDYGGKIEFIPKDPVREGYTFGGWYKEPECINAWNFESDTLPEEKKELKEFFISGETVIKEVTVYQETILYAKWE